jgi:hypothetical protein
VDTLVGHLTHLAAVEGRKRHGLNTDLLGRVVGL